MKGSKASPLVVKQQANQVKAPQARGGAARKAAGRPATKQTPRAGKQRSGKQNISDALCPGNGNEGRPSRLAHLAGVLASLLLTDMHDSFALVADIPSRKILTHSLRIRFPKSLAGLKDENHTDCTVFHKVCLEKLARQQIA